MKNKIFLSIIVFFLITIQTALATPVIQNISVDPSYLWLGEDVSIALNCFDNANNTIKQVYADIQGPGIVLPRMYFTLSSGKYVLKVDKIYLDRIGQFDATLSCENNNSETTTDSTGFKVSQLTGYISNINPSPAYIGDIIEINFIAEKDGVKLASDVDFKVKLNNELKSLKVIPAYDTNKGWVLKIDSPTISTIYNIEVTAFYDRVNVSDEDSIEVKEYIEFEIVSIDKEWIDVNDEVIVTLKALERGNVINLNENNVEIEIGSVDAEIEDITYHTGLFDVKIIAPSISSGVYKLKAILNHDGSSYSDTEDVSYVVAITGKIADDSDKGMSVRINFIRDGITKLSLVTDAFGSYSGSLPPGTYDVEIVLPKSKVYLHGTTISSFNNPIKYFYSHDVSVPGIRNAGLHDFGIALSYSSLDLELEYNERNVDDETELKIFKCSNWNSGKKVCNKEWVELVGDIDVVRNLIKIESSGLSAFVIGTIEGLKADFNLDKDVYNLEDTIVVRGIVKDLLGKTVGNASLDIEIEDTDIAVSDVADGNGVFSISVTVPEDEGNYTLSLKVKKYPYTSFKSEKTFKIAKSKTVYINFPDTIRIERGTDLTQSFSLINTGQAGLYNLTLSLEGLAEDYYRLVSSIDELKSEEEKSFSMEFSVPAYADTGISSLTLKVVGEDLYQEKVFGFNVVERGQKQNETESPTGLVTGFQFPEISLEIIYVLLLGAIGVVGALILKKRRVTTKRDSVKDFLFDVKGQLKKTEIVVKKILEESTDYDDLISSEFPEALKKLRGVVKNGKNN